MNRARERGERASRAAARRAEAATPKTPKVEPFSVLIAVPRPRYRSRAERAVAGTDWKVRSLLNREDPIGLLQQKLPDVLIIAVDVDKNKNVGHLRAAQPFRAKGLRIVGLFDTPEDAQDLAGSCDVTFAPPWRTSGLREAVAAIYTRKRGTAPELADVEEDEDGSD